MFVKEKLRQKSGILGPKKLILAFFALFGAKNLISVKVWGAYPPFPLRVFCQNDFTLRGEGGGPP